MKSVAPKPVQHPATDTPSEDGLVRPLDAQDLKPNMRQLKKNSMIIVGVYIVLILLGLGTGYLLSSKSSAGGGSSILTNTGSAGSPAKIAGVKDPSAYKDCATGKIAKGGLDGEGTHSLIRAGGPSQTAYLISSIVDLDAYMDLTVKVCGQTLQGKKVSWLMDVGRLEVQ